jgi:hypothetical protein
MFEPAPTPENATSVVVRLGCVKQRAELKPVVQIWEHSALPWLAELGGIPSTPEGSGFLPVVTPQGAA